MEPQAHKVFVEMDASYLDKLKDAGYGADQKEAFRNALATALAMKALEAEGRLLVRVDREAPQRLRFKFD